MDGHSYLAEVLEVHSGDDLVLMVTTGIPGFYYKTRVRLFGVDTPDAYKNSNETEAGKVRNKVRALTKNKICFIEVESLGNPVSGWKVVLYLGLDNTSECLNTILQDEGYIYR